MVAYENGDLIITTSIGINQHEDTKILYVGDEAFLSTRPERESSVAWPVPEGLMEIVDNWYSVHQNYLIVEVMDAGLRMKPDLVVFNYENIFLAGHDEEAIEIIIGELKTSLNRKYSVAVVYDAESSPEAPQKLIELFPEYQKVIAD